MKKRNLPTLADSSHPPGHQRPRITLSDVLRMRADGTDFGIPRPLETLARHSDQLSLAANANICAELMGSQPERPGLRQGRQFHHLCRVLRAKRNDFRRRTRRVLMEVAVFADHL